MKIVYRNAQMFPMADYALSVLPSVAEFIRLAKANAVPGATCAELQETQYARVNEGGVWVERAFTDCFEPSYTVAL